jgi:hypothetical protein
LGTAGDKRVQNSKSRIFLLVLVRQFWGPNLVALVEPLKKASEASFSARLPFFEDGRLVAKRNSIQIE